ncbi:carbohydrate-binding family 9-like protein [candidate division KSB1 bacterium]|nr:carbohydrate-binding family 9-like protein [candidate division KSB1 bacterium]
MPAAFTFILLLAHSILTDSLAGDSLFPQPQIPFAPKTYVCYRTTEPPAIDGALHETSWQQCPWTDDFIDIEGQLKPLPRYRTRAKMLWDVEYFYIAAELQEPDVWATLMQRDTVIFYDNDFEVFIDPDGDTHQYYELEINAKNTVWDLLLIKPYRDGGPAVNGWDIQGLKTAVAVQGTLNDPSDKDRGWTVEMALPWKVLKECAHRATPPESGDQWRINFSRVQWQIEKKDGRYRKIINPQTGKSFPEDNWAWSPQGLINMHYPEMWGYVQFSQKTTASQTEVFSYDPDEEVKWQLRRIYYGQRSYHRSHAGYSEQLNDLPVEIEVVEGFAWPSKIFTTPLLFEARLESSDRSRSWHINQDGRVWREDHPE